jgi:hypothetical protein
MPAMTDPMQALVSLQNAVDRQLVRLQKCDLYPDLRVLLDQPAGRTRFTYATIERRKVIAISMFVLADPIKGIPCFQTGYAVIESMRKQGLGSAVLSKGMEELLNGLKRQGPAKFYVEGIVDVSNAPSNKLAAKWLSANPKPCVDCFSGEPSMQYLKLME